MPPPASPSATATPFTRQLLRFQQLSVDQLYAALRLRADVFVVEQHCPYPDADGRDTHPDTHHLLYSAPDGTLLACARLLPAGLAYPHPSIGRVVVAPHWRGRGIAHQLLRDACHSCQHIWPQSTCIDIGAQQYLHAFYASHGFHAIGDSYLEDGIAHIDMRRPHPQPAR